jgi:L-alanine-DL-glutamate epimerase-like enolase superfamily enzyme
MIRFATLSLFVGEARVEDGHITLSDRPGLGVELNEEIVERYRLPAEVAIAS